jgi:hypothetical protein
MSETDANTEAAMEAVPATEPGPVAAPMAVPVRVPVKSRRSLWPVFFGVGFLLLAGGEAYLWTLSQAEAGRVAQFDVVQAQVADLRLLAEKTQPVGSTVTAQADLSVKFATLAAQVNALQAQVATDHGALSTLQENSVDLTALTARISRLNALETARMALDAGQPLGNIPNAPPALAQFADVAPPGEAQLRMDFPAAARAAEAASIAGEAQGTYWSRVVARLENFVTVSDGTHVLIGAPAAGVVGQAGALLNAGDLAGAVALLDTLSVSTRQAMAGWLAQAHALLAARAALLTLAGQA